MMKRRLITGASVKKKSFFLVLFTALLLFQSVWNIAAAFCNHENVTISAQGHFGHHVSGHQYTANGHDLVKNTKIMNDDHSDHLPSFSPIILASHLVNTYDRISQVDSVRILDWKNSYQSPDLEFISPPPMLTLL